ncbi:MAG TPA: hypothetical protein GXZ87_08615 [Bacteroidales bacterium]|nr:hypothetical protein [Bacteroidales bacterium]
MKTKFQLFIAAFLLASFSMSAQSTAVKDTTVFFNQKKVAIRDSVDQVKVKVYRMDSTEYKQIYEGIYTDDQTFESYSVTSQFSFDIPFIKKKKERTQLDGHFKGLSFGSLYTHNNFTDFNDTDGMKIGFSNEISVNPIEYTLPIINHYLGLISGIGMTWRNYHIGNNSRLINDNGITKVAPALDGTNYSYSRLRTFEFTVPIYLELHPLGNDKFYLMGGMLLGVNTFTSHKVKYVNERGKKVKNVLGRDYNVNPFSASWLVQMGWEDLAVFGKYTPTSLFKNGKGPDVETLSVGLSLSF